MAVCLPVHVLALGAFAKLRKAIIRFVVSVCLSVCLFVRPSVRMEQLGSLDGYS